MSGNKNVFVTADDPNGVGTTDPPGVSPSGDVVGRYVDGSGDHGFLATRVP
jgi:hypothetical protein